MRKLKNKIENLLARWETDSINERELLFEAEELFGQHYEAKELPKTNYESILIEILSHLEVLHHQLIIKDDIPAFRKFLNVTEDKELQAWKEWEKYWESINFDDRKMLLRSNEFYST